MNQKILTVTLNPAIDKLFEVKDFVKGETNRALRCTMSAGGKGINVSKVLLELGQSSFATGFLGGMNGDFIQKELGMRAIEHKFILVQQETRCNIEIKELSSGTQSELLESGFFITENQFNDFLVHFKELLKQNNFQAVALCGSLPLGAPVSAYKQLANEAKQQGMHVYLDSSGAALASGVEAGVYFIKPNASEFKALTGEDCAHLTAQNLQEWRKKLGVSVLAISFGKDGSVLCEQDGVYRALPVHVSVKNTVGCGDSMVAAYCYAHLNGQRGESALRLAAAAAAANAVTSYSAVIDAQFCKSMTQKIDIIRLNHHQIITN